jgi:hypothetical protein
VPSRHLGSGRGCWRWEAAELLSDAHNSSNREPWGLEGSPPRDFSQESSQHKRPAGLVVPTLEDGDKSVKGLVPTPQGIANIWEP